MMSMRWCHLAILAQALFFLSMPGCDDADGTTPEVVTQQSELRILDPCIFGEDYVYIGGRTEIQGDVASNGTITLEAGSADLPTTVDGTVAALGNVQLNGGTSLVTQDVLSNSEVKLQLGAEVAGEIIAPAIVYPEQGTPVAGDDPALSAWSIPEKEVQSNNTDEIFAGYYPYYNCGQTLPSNSIYGSLQVMSNCSIFLESGVYVFRNVRVEPDAQIIIPNDAWVQIQTEDYFYLGDRSRLTGISNPEQLDVYANGEVFINNDTQFTGNITAPHDGVSVRRSEFKGCVQAQDVWFTPDATQEPSDSYGTQGTLERFPVTLDGTMVDTNPNQEEWQDAELIRANPTDPYCIGGTRLKDPPGNGVIYVAACADHFPPCDYDDPLDCFETMPDGTFIAGGSLDGLTARKGPVDMVLIEDE